jgi:hypothetical protein
MSWSSRALAAMPSLSVKPSAKVLDVLRGGEHHRVGEAVIDEGDRRLFGDRVLAEDRGVGAPAFDAVAAVRPAAHARLVLHRALRRKCAGSINPTSVTIHNTS